jgi:hypothetical protein
MKPRKTEGLVDILARLAKSDHKFYGKINQKKKNFNDAIKKKENKVKELMKTPASKLSPTQLKTRSKKMKRLINQAKKQETAHYKDLKRMINGYFDKTRASVQHKNGKIFKEIKNQINKIDKK